MADDGFSTFDETLRNAATAMRERMRITANKVFIPEHAWERWGSERINTAATRLGIRARHYAEIGLPPTPLNDEVT